MAWYQFVGMTKRNVAVFLKDKTAVFFSMLAPLITMFLYLVFLKSTYMNSINEGLKPLKDLIDFNDVDSFSNAWLLSGVLGTSCVTISLNSLAIMVEDKERKIDYDYSASPIKKEIIILSYFFGSLINTLIIGLIILSTGLIVLSIIGNLYLNLWQILYLYLILFIGCSSSTMLMMIIVAFFKKTTAFSAFSGIVSAIIGFLIGAYVPVGSLSSGVQNLASFIPGAHIAALFRNNLMGNILDKINSDISGIDNGQFYQNMYEQFALKLNFFGYELNDFLMIIYVLLIIVVCFVINYILYKKSSVHK